MKKTYIFPAILTVQLSSRNALMTLSAASSLDGAGYGGTTEDNNILDADVKVWNDVNLWDEEW